MLEKQTKEISDYYTVMRRKDRKIKLFKDCEDVIQTLKSIHSGYYLNLEEISLEHLENTMSETVAKLNLNKLVDESRTENSNLNNRSVAYNYVTAEDVKNSAEKVETGIKTFIMDINLMPAEYKDEDIIKTVENYEKAFNVRIIPIDSSRANMQGGNEAFIRQLF